MTPQPFPNETAHEVFRRTYSRVKPDGQEETWGETVNRVVRGNLALVDERYIEPHEKDRLEDALYFMDILPAGRHLWASGIPGGNLFNCWVAGAGESLADHVRFTFLRLLEGGGVGMNYASNKLEHYGPVRQNLALHLVCSSDHPDYPVLASEGLLSATFVSDWLGAYEVGDSREGWADALGDLVETFYRTDVKHRNRVYDLSRIRASGTPLKHFGGTASGPVAFARMLHEVVGVLNWAGPPLVGDSVFPGVTIPSEGRPLNPLEVMEIDHAAAACVVSGGIRRSARMSILPWDDPYIEEFITCKQDTSKHWTTNISVAVDEGFFKALNETTVVDDDWGAHTILTWVASGMLKNGEPGLVNLARANAGEPNRVECCNPCGEQFLEEYEPCCLGHVNLDKFADRPFEDLLEAHRLMTRFLIRATFAEVKDPRSRAVLDRNRRIGVGHLGVQAYLAKNETSISEVIESGSSSIDGEDWFRDELRVLRQSVQRAAREYAHQLRIPTPVKCTTVAPTGTIAKLAGTTEGCHPVYARHFLRRIRFSTTDPRQRETLADYEARKYQVEPCRYAADTAVVTIPTEDRLVAELRERGLSPSLVEDASDLTIREHLSWVRLYQENYADGGVSYTVNWDPTGGEVEELADYLKCFLPDLKGLTLMPDGSREQAPYERITSFEYEKMTWYGCGAVESSVSEECVTGACPVR